MNNHVNPLLANIVNLLMERPHKSDEVVIAELKNDTKVTRSEERELAEERGENVKEEQYYHDYPDALDDEDENG
jgi:hypothetical protein